MAHRRSCRPRLAPICAAALLSACAENGPAYEPPAGNVAATVEMREFRFHPETLRINAGDTVEWRNKSYFTHTVTADPARNAEDISLPPGAAPFESGRIPPGQVYRHTFTDPGTYRYICIPHGDLGMTGSVIVAPRS